MGHCNFSAIGYGMTEQEAYRNAVESAKEEYGHQDGYSGAINSRDYDYPMKTVCLVKPRYAKTCKVEKKAKTGTRKWVTKYFLYPEHEGRCIKNFIKQGEAIKEAKIYALKNNTGVSIEIKKVLENGGNEIAIIRPKKSTMGKWSFSGTARE